MKTVTLDEARRNLVDLVHQLSTRGEVLILESDRPVARLSPIPGRPSLRSIKPASVGAILRPFPSPEDDLLEEMTRPPQ